MSVYDYIVTTANGEEQALRIFAGQVLLIVNTASKCGFTPQYQGLQNLHHEFRDKGFSVLAFPCNQFAKQEPGTNEQIQDFCSSTYGATFPIYAKVNVNGKEAHPLFEYLKRCAPGVLRSRSIKWNFTKFLINRNGEVTMRYAPRTAPSAIMKDIQKLLGE